MRVQSSGKIYCGITLENISHPGVRALSIVAFDAMQPCTHSTLTIGIVNVPFITRFTAGSGKLLDRPIKEAIKPWGGKR